MKNWIKKVWALILKWGKETALPWLLKSWIQIINIIIIFIGYVKLSNNGISGAKLFNFWIFILMAYWIFWKFLGADKIIMPTLKKWWKKIFGKK